MTTDERINQALRNADTHAQTDLDGLTGVVLILCSAVVLALLAIAVWYGASDELTPRFIGACWITACFTLVAGISVLRHRT